MANGNGIMGNFMGDVKKDREAAYAFMERLEQRIEQLVENTEGEVESEVYRQISGVGVVAAGATDVNVELQAPPGISWEVIRIATTSGAGPCTVYLNSIHPQNLIDFASNAQLTAWGPSNKFYVPETQKIIFHFYNQVAGQECTVAVQAREFESGPKKSAAPRAVGER